MKYHGVHYGKNSAGMFTAHVLRDQTEPFAMIPLSTTLCGLAVFDFDSNRFTANKVCKTCLKLALDAGMPVEYRLPLDMQGVEA